MMTVEAKTEPVCYFCDGLSTNIEDCDCMEPCEKLDCPADPENDDEFDWVDEADEDGTLLDKVFPSVPVKS